MLQAIEKIELAKSRLATEIDRPFYYGIVYRRPIIWGDPGVKTAAMDSRGNMYMCEEFIDKLSIDNCVFLLAHEALHFMLRHCDRRGERDPKAWNIAADKVINDMLVYDKVGEHIPSGVFQAGAREFTADQLYVAPGAPDPGAGASSDPGGGKVPNTGATPGADGKPSNGGIGDDIIEIPMDDEEKAQVEAELTQDVLAAVKMSKMRGVGVTGGVLGDLIKKITTKPVPWHALLLQHMTDMFPAEMCWTRPNKKYRHLGITMPIVKREPRLDHMCIILDTSISVSQEEIEMYMNHVNTIFELLPPRRVTILQGGSSVKSEETYTNDELPITLDRLFIGGGTNFEPLLAYADNLPVPVDLCLYFTDLESSTAFAPPSFPVIWASTNCTNNKFGDLVEIEKS